MTKWIAENVRHAYRDHPLLWLMLCLSRQINWPATLNDLITFYPGAWPGDELFDLKHLEAALEDRASMNLKVFTGVYVISAPSTKGAKKAGYVANSIIGSLWRDRAKFERYWKTPNTERRLRDVHKMLVEYPGWGPFLSYQAVVDMRFTELLNRATDLETWCAIGPGTLRGLNRLHGRPLELGLTKLASLDVQSRGRKECLELWPILMKETGVTMDLSDVPNVLCETDKYLRVKNGEGEPRTRFVPSDT